MKARASSRTMSWPVVIPPKRAFLLCALIGAILAAVVLALRWRSIAEYIVTSAAIADAREELAKRRPYGDSFVDDAAAVTDAVTRGSNAWFRAGYLDRELLLGAMASGRDALEAGFVLSSHYQSLGREDERFVVEEITTWCRLVARSSPAKDLLVDSLVGDLPWFPRCPKDPAEEAQKLILFALLFSPSMAEWLYQPLSFVISDIVWTEREQQVLASIDSDAWHSILRDTGAPREKTRAGAFLLLYRHPDPLLFEKEARRALDDPSRLVRLAAAGTLALKGIDAGEGHLLEGMSHERWEIRFWCLHGIRALGKDSKSLIDQRLREEKDPWLIRILRKEPHAVPGPH